MGMCGPGFAGLSSLTAATPATRGGQDPHVPGEKVVAQRSEVTCSGHSGNSRAAVQTHSLASVRWGGSGSHKSSLRES